MTLEQAFVMLLLMLVAQAPILVAAIVSYLKSKAAIDENTKLTKAGTAVAATNAREAAAAATDAKDAATDAKVVAESIDKKLNGGIDDTINAAVRPIYKAIEDHAAADDKNMQEIRTKFDGLTQYIHQRNHDILDALNEHSLKVDVALTETARGPSK